MTQIEQELQLLSSLLDCAILASENHVKELHYHPVGFADMIANLGESCHISDVLDVVNQFVKKEIEYIQEDE